MAPKNHRHRARAPRRSSTKWLIKLHSLTGLLAVVAIIILVISGWALNHTNGLGLSSAYVKNNWILGLYQVSENPEIGEFSAQDVVVSKIDDSVYLGSAHIFSSSNTVLGITLHEDIVYVFSPSSVRLFSLLGEHIETAALSEEITEVGSLIGQIVLLRDTNGGLLGLNVDSLTLDSGVITELPTPNASDWQKMSTQKQPAYPSIITDWKGRIITTEQVLLDIHSGRLFGAAGVWLVDLFGLLLLFLALTGPVIWVRRRRRRSRKDNRLRV